MSCSSRRWATVSKMTPILFKRGDIWLVNFVPARGHEQDGQRPAAIISIDPFSHGPAGLLIVAPLTSTDRAIPFHVAVKAPEGGLRVDSFILCDQVVTIARARAMRRWGSLTERTMSVVADRLSVLMGL